MDYVLQELRYSHLKFVKGIAPILKKKIQFWRGKITIVRYMKHMKTEPLSSKLVRFSKQISNVNILALVGDNPSSKFSQVGESLGPNICLKNVNSWVHFGLIFAPNFDDLGLFLGPKWQFLGQKKWKSYGRDVCCLPCVIICSQSIRDSVEPSVQLVCVVMPTPRDDRSRKSTK